MCCAFTQRLLWIPWLVIWVTVGFLSPNSLAILLCPVPSTLHFLPIFSLFYTVPSTPCDGCVWKSHLSSSFQNGKNHLVHSQSHLQLFFTAILMLVWILADTLEFNCVKTWIACITLPRRFERTVSSSGMWSTLQPLTVRFNHEIIEFLMNILIAVKVFEFWHVSNFEIRQPNKWDDWQLAVTCVALLELTSLYSTVKSACILQPSVTFHVIGTNKHQIVQFEIIH